MAQPLTGRRKKSSYILPFLFALSIALGSFLYVFRCGVNPPGFFVDESSIAFNAYTISVNGTDESGQSLPLFFKAFGDYKNPVYIYLLALVFKVTGPGILAARLQSAILGVLTALLLGLLAHRVSRDETRHEGVVGLIMMTMAFLTPWLFEMSRVVLEVALYPLIVVLFLVCVRQASKQERWRWSTVLCLSFTLALLTYSYSIGRLLAPLLAFGLVLFANRERWPGIIRTWAIYLLTLVPLIAYQREHQGALTGRFRMISNSKPGDSWLASVWVFVKHYLGNIDPRRLFILGDPNIYQVSHLYGKPVLLIATLLLLALGIGLVLKNHRSDSWWRFVIYATAVSVVPASLTVDYLHMLRLAALPVFLLVLTIPALVWLIESRRRNGAIAILVLLTLGQGLFFQFQYQRSSLNSPWRRRLFDADYREKIFDLALTKGSKPFYVSDPLNTPYIQAYWYGTLNHFGPTDLVRLGNDVAPPLGAVVIANDESCVPKDVISRDGPYMLFIANQSSPRAPLPDSAFRAELGVLYATPEVHAGGKIDLQVLVLNGSNVTWPGCQHGSRDFQIYLGSHWLDSSEQHWTKDEGRAPLPTDLAPGESTIIGLTLNAPTQPGEYVIELDLVQEKVSWFGLKGSHPTKLRLRVV